MEVQFRFLPGGDLPGQEYLFDLEGHAESPEDASGGPPEGQGDSRED